MQHDLLAAAFVDLRLFETNQASCVHGYRIIIVINFVSHSSHISTDILIIFAGELISMLSYQMYFGEFIALSRAWRIFRLAMLYIKW